MAVLACTKDQMSGLVKLTTCIQTLDGDEKLTWDSRVLTIGTRRFVNMYESNDIRKDDARICQSLTSTTLNLGVVQAPLKEMFWTPGSCFA